MQAKVLYMSGNTGDQAGEPRVADEIVYDDAGRTPLGDAARAPSAHEPPFQEPEPGADAPRAAGDDVGCHAGANE